MLTFINVDDQLAADDIDLSGKESIAELMKMPATVREIKRAFQRVQEYEDLPFVIVLHSVVEQQFKEAARSQFENPDCVSIRSLGDAGRMLEALGLTSSEITKRLGTLSKIRNAFAHSTLRLSLDHTALAGACKSLSDGIGDLANKQMQGSPHISMDFHGDDPDWLKSHTITDKDGRAFVSFDIGAEYQETTARGDYFRSAIALMMIALSLRRRPNKPE